jgi:cell division protein FtsZ
MGSGNRASMREGPLAQLFRNTDENARTDVERERREAEAREQREAQERREREAEEQRAQEARREREARRARRVPAGQPEPGPGRRTPARPPEPRGGGRRSASAPDGPPAAPARVPSPEERLRSVFSADIPENILDRTPARVESEPAFGRPPVHNAEPVLKVVGVGGAGVNAVNRMIEAEVEGVEFVAVNTDLQSLEQSAAGMRVHIGNEVTRGLGSGSDPDLGRAAAVAEYDRLKSTLKGSDMVFIAAGAGGGTGTGAAPVVAQISREVGALTVGIVTKPFGFEGARRSDQAEQGVEDLAREVDTLIVIPNSRLLAVLDKKTSMVEAFRVADDVLRQGVQGISDLITLPGLINLDFADVRTIMSEAGQALLGIGMGTGDGRAVHAALHAVESPLLETSVEGARSLLLSITGGPDLSLWEVNEAAKAVAEAAHSEANIIFGAMVDEKVGDQVWVTVVATGYGDRPVFRASPRAEGSGVEADTEPRVRRVPAEDLNDVEVPEFVPRR